ncbi:MAG TPA: hypothetical protein VF627_06095 [Abditibacterium sp.]|jgi:hypothetical protein
MTEEEFRIEARRVLIAFDFRFNDELKIRKRREYGSRLNGRIIYEFRWINEDVNIDFGTFEIVNSWSFELFKDGSRLECDSWPIDPTIYAEEGNPSQFALRMARGMSRLGYDISLIETEFDLNITAHQKLEWQLEFQRRLREGVLSKLS